MHVRIRQRRESVAEQIHVGEGARDFTGVLQMMKAIEAKAAAINAACLDDRVPALMAAIKSAKTIVEMSVRSDETAALLMPCANAALLHVRSEMLSIRCELSDRVAHECDLRQPHAEIMAPRRPA